MAKAAGSKRTPVPAGTTMTKRGTHKPVPASPTYHYVTRQTSLHALVKRVRAELVQRGGTCVTLCGMGAAVAKTSLLALQIQDMLTPPPPSTTAQDGLADATPGGLVADVRPRKSVELRVRTGTVELVDELLPDDPDLDVATQVRRNSKIEIDLVVVHRRS